MHPSDPQRDCLDILARHNAVLTGDHFVYTAGHHGDTYVAKDAIIPHTTDLAELCSFIAAYWCNAKIDVVIAPATAGIALSQWVTHHLRMLGAGSPLALYADKMPDGSFALRRNYDQLARGKRALVVEDIINTGKSIRGTIRAAWDCQANVIGASALANRGEVSAEDLNIPMLHSLVNPKLKKYPAVACPLCIAGVPINTQLGHGAAYVAAHGQPVCR